MPRPKRWKLYSIGHARWEAELFSWKYFPDFIHKFADVQARTTIWRGQASANWALDTTLDRLLRKAGKPVDFTTVGAHLNNFRLAARGRRGAHPRDLTENEWWALGQHHGLATPLLDWSRSPYVALYFAFENADNGGDNLRAVWALNRTNVEDVCKRIEDGTHLPSEPVTPLVFLEPMLDENARLVNQAGLFSRAPIGHSIEPWLQVVTDESETAVALTRITIPNTDREACLRSLNAMNINHKSLFPDLAGASIFCNLDLAIDSY